VLHHHGAGHRLQQTPGQILDGDRQREVRHRDGEVAGELRGEQAEALPQTETQRQHQRRSEQDRIDRPERPQICHRRVPFPLLLFHRRCLTENRWFATSGKMAQSQRA
jgi:hypothetical protein